MATLNQKELHHIFRIQDSKNLLGWLQWRQNNSMAEWHILSKNVNAMWKKAELWYCPRCIGTCWLGRDKVWGKDIWVRDSFKCCELHLGLSRHNKKKQHKQDSLYINYLRDKTHSIGRTKWQEGQSTRLFAGLKPKWVLMKYFLTSSSKYRSLIFFFLILQICFQYLTKFTFEQQKFTINIKIFPCWWIACKCLEKTHTFSFCPEPTAILLVQKWNKIQIALKWGTNQKV